MLTWCDANQHNGDYEPNHLLHTHQSHHIEPHNFIKSSPDKPAWTGDVMNFQEEVITLLHIAMMANWAMCLLDMEFIDSCMDDNCNSEGSNMVNDNII